MFIIIFILLFFANNLLAKDELKNYKWKIPQQDNYSFMSISEDNSRFLMSGFKSFKIFETKTNKLIKVIPYDGYSFIRHGFFISNDELLLFENSGIYKYNMLSSTKNKLPTDNFSFNGYPAISNQKDKFACIFLDSIFIYDLYSNKVTNTFTINFKNYMDNDNFNDISFSKDGKSIFAITEYSYVFVWNINDNELKHIINIPKEFGVNNFSTHGNNFIDWLNDSTLITNRASYSIWNYKTGKYQYSICTLGGFCNLNLSTNRRYLSFLKGNSDDGLSIYDIPNGEVVALLDNSGLLKEKYDHVILENDGEIIFLSEDFIKKYDFINDMLIDYVTTNYVEDIVISNNKDNPKVYTLGNGLCILNAVTGDIEECIDDDKLGKERGIYSKVMNNATDEVVFLSGNEIIIYNILTEKIIYQEIYHYETPKYLYFKYSPNDKYLGIGDNRHKYIKILDANSYSLVDSFSVDYDFTDYDFSPDNTKLVYTQQDHTSGARLDQIRIRDLVKKEEVCSDEIPFGNNYTYRFVSDKYILGHMGSIYDYIELIEPCGPRTGHLLRYPDYISDFKVSKDYKYCIGLSGSYDSEDLFIFEILEKKMIRAYKFDRNVRLRYAISGDNKNIAVGDDNFLYYFDFEKFTPVVDYSDDLSDFINAYPIPCDDILNIESQSQNISSIIVYDLFGKEVQKINNINGNRYELSTGMLAVGIYSIVVNYDRQKIKTIKLTVIH